MLRVLLLILLVLVVPIIPAQAFDSYEHSEICDEAFQFANAALKQSRSGSYARLGRRPHLSTQHEAIDAVVNG